MVMKAQKNEIETRASRLHEGCLIGIENYRVQALIGVHAHEMNRRQPLLVTTTLEVNLPNSDCLASTVNYSKIASIIDGVSNSHNNLIESFAAQIAQKCLLDPYVAYVRVHVQKPWALSDGVAWTEVYLRQPHVNGSD